MRIGIDARFFGNNGGIARYVKRLVEELEHIDHTNEYIIFLRSQNWRDYSPNNPRFSKVRADIPWYGLKEQILMLFHIRRARVDVMHFPHWNIPLLYRGPFIVTIHDLILLRFPSTRATTRSRLTYWFKYLCYRLVILRAVQCARHICVPSEFTKHDIIRTFHVSPDRITVTYEGTDVIQPASDSSIEEKTLNAFGIHTPYLLYEGVAYPHKNLEWLIEAMEEYNRRNQQKIQLVLSGELNYFYKRIQQTFVEQIHRRELVIAGFVPDDEISILFRHANAYVMPSLYEGFGLPALQACAYKIPVISSNRASMPEILGNAALYFDPSDTDDFIHKLQIITNDASIREQLVQNGFKRYQQFSWTRMAHETLSVYLK